MKLSYSLWRLFFITLFSVTLYPNNSFAQEETTAADLIENINVSATASDAVITWNIKYDKFPLNRNYVIRFLPANKTKIDLNPDWNYTKIIPTEQNTFTLTDVVASEKYAFQIGVLPSGNTETSIDKIDKNTITWYKSKSFSTSRGWSVGNGLIMRILMLLGALGLFIYGMKTMSEGIQKAAGNRLRQILGSMTSNRIKGIFTGFLTTSIVQSSSATTVMVVSFVNAGLLSLRQSIGVIMGANIGTTVTAWLVAYVGFKISMSDYSLPIFLVAIIFLFSNKSQLKSWGEMLAGFAILFIGLEMLKSGVPGASDIGSSLEFIKDWSGTGVGSVLLAVIIGTIITIVVQSSSAAMAVTILLCYQNIIPFEMAAGMVLGENIGTTITANIAATVGNVHAKRAARAHLVFNVFGVVWMVCIFGLFIKLTSYIVEEYMLFPNPTVAESPSTPVGLAVFHTLFNIMNVLVMVWFVNPIAKLVIKLVPSKGVDDEVFHLDYIKSSIVATPELTIIEAKKEVAKFGKITSRMSHFFAKLLTEHDKKSKKSLYEKIAKYEEITDRVELEITDYLSKAAQNELSETTSRRIRGMMAITNDLERIGDIFYQMSLTHTKKEEGKIWFSPEQRTNIQAMIKLIDEAFVIMIDNLNAEYNKLSIQKAIDKESEINAFRDKLRNQHLENIEKREYNFQSGMIYSDLFYSLEKIGDHIINVSEAVSGKNIIGE